TVNAESVIRSPDMPGLDEVHVLVPKDLRGVGAINLSLQSDGHQSNPVNVSFTGDPSREVFINEVLADPPNGIAGDANHDGVRDGAGNLISQFSYGGSTGLDGNNGQSLTRSPDITGSFVQHTAAEGANGRLFSPGLKTNGTPFGNCPGHLIAVSIAPLAATLNVGEKTQFAAQSVDEYGRAMQSEPVTF